MGWFEKVSAAGALADLFERERRAVIAGRFDLLSRLVVEKERQLASVVRAETDREIVENLRDMAERNKRLLAAMDAGIRSALGRLEQLRNPPAALQTYDAAGQRQPVDAPVPSRALRRRA